MMINDTIIVQMNMRRLSVKRGIKWNCCQGGRHCAQQIYRGEEVGHAPKQRAWLHPDHCYRSYYMFEGL